MADIHQMMLFIIIYLLLEGAEGVSVPQPVVLPPPVPHLRLIPAEQRIPAIFAPKSLNRQTLPLNLERPRSHRRPIPTRLLFEESSHLSEHDTPDYPLHLQRQPDMAYRRPPAPRPAADFYLSVQRPSNPPEFATSEEVSSNGFPSNLQNPRFEFGFLPLTSNRVAQSVPNATSTHRNVTIFRSNVTSSSLGFRPLYTDLPKNDIGYSQSEVLATSTESNRSFNCGGREDLNWCEIGRNYPSVDIQHLLSRCTNLMGKLYVEIPENSNGLVDTGENQQPDFISVNGKRRNANPWSWGSYSREGQFCDGQKTFAKPDLAKDTKGKWYIIVQTANYVQRVPLEECSNAGQPCAEVSSCAVKSRCVQKYSYNLLISVDPQKFSDCPFMRLYEFPSICTCQVINNS